MQPLYSAFLTAPLISVLGDLEALNNYNKSNYQTNNISFPNTY